MEGSPRMNYAGRTSTTPYSVRWDPGGPDRRQKLVEALALPETAPDSAVSTLAERAVWYVAGFDPGGDQPYIYAAQSGYDDSSMRFPTLEWMVSEPLRVDHVYLHVRGAGAGNSTRGSSLPEIERYRLLLHVILVLTRVFDDTLRRHPRDVMRPQSFLAVLRSIYIDIFVPDQLGEKILTDFVRALARLETAFTTLANFLHPHIRRGHVDRDFRVFPLSISYNMKIWEWVWTGTRHRQIRREIRNHLRIGGRQDEPTWEEESWNPLNASKYFRQQKRVAANVLGRQVHGRPGWARYDDDDDEGYIPVIVALSRFTP